MKQCIDCPYCEMSTSGEPILSCDPYSTIVEPECLTKWQLVKLEELLSSYKRSANMHQRLAPLQERMIRHIERELNEAEEADSWKYEFDEEEDEE